MTAVILRVIIADMPGNIMVSEESKKYLGGTYMYPKRKYQGMSYYSSLFFDLDSVKMLKDIRNKINSIFIYIASNN